VRLPAPAGGAHLVAPRHDDFHFPVFNECGVAALVVHSNRKQEAKRLCEASSKSAPLITSDGSFVSVFATTSGR
jgi:hypothetical protein